MIAINGLLVEEPPPWGLSYQRRPIIRTRMLQIMKLTRSTSLSDLLPSEFYLSQNHPNPFSEITTIKLCVAYKTKVKLEVFDSEGMKVQILIDEEKEAGTYEVEFSAKKLAARSARGISSFGGDTCNLSEGIYVYQLRAGDFSATKKMLLLKRG